MTTQTPADFDGADIRANLVPLRDAGMPWTVAWRTALGLRADTSIAQWIEEYASHFPLADSNGDPVRFRIEAELKDLYRFAEKHFEAAYNGDDSPRGRCMVPARDTSSAVPAHGFSERTAEIIEAARERRTLREIAEAHGISHQRVHQIIKKALPKATHDHERCRSGAGCDRLATRGRFGKMWCEYHGAELERITAAVKEIVGNLDPRNGNATISGARTRGAA